MTSKAGTRRALALLPDAGRLPLAAKLTELATGGPLPVAEVGDLLAGYLFDPSGAAILAATDARARWLEGPLFEAVGPGNAAPLRDDVAAVIAGPLLVRGGALSPVVTAQRFAPRADDAVAVAIAALEPAKQPTALEALFADQGPEPALLALATVQCGRVLAWSPHLLETAVAEQIVSALVTLLDPSRPRPLLDAAARALGPIAATATPLGERVRTAAFAGIDAAARPIPSSFADELAAIGKTRRVPDLDRMIALPRREVAAACAYILGCAAPSGREPFAAHRALVLDRPDGEELTGAFVDGLVATAHVAAIAELCAGLIDDQPAAALGLAASLPLDALAPLLLGELDTAAPARRVLACAAVELLEADEVDRALAMRLGDPAPEVAAAATRTLLARGRRDLIGEHATREHHPIRRAIGLAALGELTVPVIGELVRGVLADVETAETAEAAGQVSPITRLLGDGLLCTIEGFALAADLIEDIPEAAGLLALAATAADRDIGVLAPPAARLRLAQVALPLASRGDDTELGALALYLMARVSAGDTTLGEMIADALDATEGEGANLVAALGELRAPTAHTAAALAPIVAPDQPIGARVIAAAACGRALPHDHPAWADVRELLELGTIARAAAWSALRDRARRRVA